MHVGLLMDIYYVINCGNGGQKVFHIVLMPERSEYLSKWMQWLMTSHVRRYHRHYGTSGHVWQGRFKSFIIQEDVHLLMVLRYIEGNPVRAGLARSAKDWRWSSHKWRINKGAGFLVEEVPIELPEDWDRYVDEPFTEKELESLRRSVNRQSPFGDFEWQRRVSEKFGEEGQGRMRKSKRKVACPLSVFLRDSLGTALLKICIFCLTAFFIGDPMGELR